MGVLGLHDSLPVIVPLATVPLPANSMKVPSFSPRTKSKFNVALAGAGFAATPIRTPSPVLLALLSNPFPEMEPCPVLLLLGGEARLRIFHPGLLLGNQALDKPILFLSFL